MRHVFSGLLAVLCCAILTRPAAADGCPEGYKQVGTRTEETADAIIEHPVCDPIEAPAPPSLERPKHHAKHAAEPPPPYTVPVEGTVCTEKGCVTTTYLCDTRCTLEDLHNRLRSDIAQVIWNVRVWLNDPMHRGWTRDAATIATLPIAAQGALEAFAGEGVVLGGGSKAAIESEAT